MKEIVINLSDLKKMKDLSSQNLILYHIIKSFIDGTGSCQLSTKKLSELSNIPYNNINRNLNQLSKLNYILIKKEMANLNKNKIYILK